MKVLLFSSCVKIDKDSGNGILCASPGSECKLVRLAGMLFLMFLKAPRENVPRSSSPRLHYADFLGTGGCGQ